MQHKEDDLQKMVFKYLGMQYPNVLAHHSPNGGKRNFREAARFKAQGVKPGCPDILIFKQVNKKTASGVEYYPCGIAVELKIKPNKPNPEQLDFQEQLRRQGWITKVCYTFDEAKFEIDSYLS